MSKRLPEIDLEKILEVRYPGCSKRQAMQRYIKDEREFDNALYCPRCGTEGAILHMVHREGSGVGHRRIICINFKCDLSEGGDKSFIVRG